MLGSSPLIKTSPACKTMYLLLYVSSRCRSCLNVIFIAFDRLFAVSLHLRYQELVMPRRITIVLVSVWIISCVFAFLFIFFQKEIGMVAAVISLAGYILTIVVYVRIYKVVKYHQNQIYSQNQLQNAQTREAHRQRKSAYNSLFVAVVFLLVIFLFFLVPYCTRQTPRKSRFS